MQMEKPDRDPKNADQAEQEYRTMIQQFPDSTFVPRAKQRLREVQEVLAERQYQVGSFYASHENWAATIARLQTVTDSYPLYSHSDLALIGLGDAYAAEARYVQGLTQINPKAKQELMKAYDDQAADAYARVVTHYSMAAHVEDARERLIALNRPVPDPTKEELANSEAEEQSRTGITFKDRALLLVKRGPVTVNAARIGEPTLTDPPAITAPEVHKRDTALFTAALNNQPLPAPAPLGPPTSTAVASGGAAAPEPAAGSTLQLENVPSADNGAPAGGGPGIGASIVSTGEGSTGAAPAQSGPPTSTPPPASAPVGAAGYVGWRSHCGCCSRGARRAEPGRISDSRPDQQPAPAPGGEAGRGSGADQRCEKRDCCPGADRHRCRRHQRQIQEEDAGAQV